jgi:hypothetical protein
MTIIFNKISFLCLESSLNTNNTFSPQTQPPHLINLWLFGSYFYLKCNLSNMSERIIRCQNPDCNNKFKVQYRIQSKPILFCSKLCLNSILIKDKINRYDDNFDHKDPKEVRRLAKDLIIQTKLMQNELKKLRVIRNTYFTIFKNENLKHEIYKRKWSFE